LYYLRIKVQFVLLFLQERLVSMAKQSEKKYQKLLEKAEELFWKYGYGSVSVDQIAKEAGISKMTIYKHFHSKEDLFIEVLMKYTVHHMNILQDKINAKYHTFEKIQEMYDYTLNLSNTLSPIFIKEIMDRAHILQRLVSYKQEKMLVMWRSIVEDGIRKKEIRNLDVDFTANLLLHMPNAFIRSEDYMDETKRLKMLENFFDFLKFGLLGGIENPK